MAERDELRGLRECSPPPGAPILYETLAKKGSEGLESTIDLMKSDVRGLERKLTLLIDDAYTRGYREGLRDGFGQGVAAEAKRHEAPA